MSRGSTARTRLGVVTGSAVTLALALSGVALVAAPGSPVGPVPAVADTCSYTDSSGNTVYYTCSTTQPPATRPPSSSSPAPTKTAPAPAPTKTTTTTPTGSTTGSTAPTKTTGTTTSSSPASGTTRTTTSTTRSGKTSGTSTTAVTAPTTVPRTSAGATPGAATATPAVGTSDAPRVDSPSPVPTPSSSPIVVKPLLIPAATKRAYSVPVLPLTGGVVLLLGLAGGATYLLKRRRD